MDTIPIDISGPDLAGSAYHGPGLAWSGRNYLVAWSASDRAMFALVEPDGHIALRRVLQDSVQVLSNTSMAVGFDGANFLVAWCARPVDSIKAQFVRITPDGVVLDSPPCLLAAHNAEQYGVAVAYHGDRYLAAWDRYSEGDYEIWGSFIFPDGSVQDSFGFLIHGGVNTEGPAVSHDGSNFVVAFYEWHYKLKLTRVSDEGQVLDTTGVLVDSLSSLSRDVFSHGGRTLVAWEGWHAAVSDSAMVKILTVDSALTPLDTVRVVSPMIVDDSPNVPEHPAIGLNGDNWLVTWCQPFLDDTILRNKQAAFRRFDPAGQPLDSAAVIASYGPNLHSYADVACDGRDYLAVWVETRTTPERYSYSVKGMRFSSSGVPLDTVIRIGGSVASNAAVAYCAGTYLVCWRDVGASLVAARVNRAGSVLDSLPIIISPESLTASTPDVAASDSVFLLVWRYSYHILARRVLSSGVILDTAPILVTHDPYERPLNPRICYGEDDFLVTWVEDRAERVLATRVTPAGEILDTASIDIGEARASTVPHCAYGRGVYMVLDDRAGWVRRVSTEGVLLDTAVQVPGLSGYMKVGFDGAGFVVLDEAPDEVGHGVGAVRYTPQGARLDDYPFLLVDTDSQPVSERHGLALVSDSAGQCGVTVSVRDPRAGTYRIRASVFPAVNSIVEEVGQRALHDVRVSPSLVSHRAMLNLSLAAPQHTEVSVFDAAGRRQALLLRQFLPAGRHRFRLDLSPFAHGVAFVCVRAGSEQTRRKVVVAR